jgi:hypothetical protein
MPTVTTEDLWSDVWSDTWPGSTTYVPDPVYTGTRLPKVTLNINGQNVAASAVNWDAADGEGFRSLTATITREDALRLNVIQGSEVHLWESAAECHFDGMLTGPPTLHTNGTATFTVNGWAVVAEKRTDALPYQTRDYSLWSEGDSDPHTYPEHQHLRTDIKAGSIVLAQDRFDTGAGDASLFSTSVARAVLWQPGALLTRFATSVNKKTGNSSEIELKLSTHVGPNGAGLVTTTYALTSGNPGATITETFGSPQDQISFRITPNTTMGGSWPRVLVTLNNVRVNGRNPNGTGPAGDSWTVRELLGDVGAMCGYDTSQNLASTLNILPWWEAEGSSWLDNMVAATDLSDDHFGIYEHKKLYSGPWSTSPIWKVRNGPHVDLADNVIHTRVQVTYDNPKGKPKQITVINTAAEAKYGINIYEVELPDPQADSTFATAVANALLPVVSEESHNGIIQTTEYRDASGAIKPYGPRPGHRVTIEDWRPGMSYTARITSTSGAQGEPLTLGVEGAEANPERILLNAEKAEDRRRKGRKRHRKRKRKRRKD